MIDIVWQVFSSLFEGYATQKHKMRILLRSQAKTLIDQEGSKAFDTALQVANLAQEREDAASAEMWLEIAKEISRQKQRNLRRSFLENIIKR